LFSAHYHAYDNLVLNSARCARVMKMPLKVRGRCCSKFMDRDGRNLF
jgi:hypothetical protein